MWAVVPFKDPGQAKQRLAGLLTGREREDLSRAMLEDVLTVLLKTDFLEAILIVSDDPNTGSLTRNYNIQLAGEDKSCGEGLNGAITGAVRKLQSRPINDVLIIHGDIPLVSLADLNNLARAHHQRGVEPAVTIVPDRNQQGTNAMICSPPEVITFCYGENSLKKHLQSAQQHHVSTTILTLPSIMFDIDTHTDFLDLLKDMANNYNNCAMHTRRFLDDSGIKERMKSLSTGSDMGSGHAKEVRIV